ncbi:hypothetical protein DACRYDRAFT_20824 [Dacryopinax primogenitus]|uniref:Uncharacterized protein n=1 Tax=Dacryopinax primogenitus (strain DJM 731) TaxID=1858805 RepID=M5G7W1_DACPD|nr:uncharacterized protein DACRYDRAFT_20824 [Dacryopinax primogenitus]EJU04220.1 hypothetical protein DACRYDRAFT_20824 [Dacryopinax primogenitus]
MHTTPEQNSFARVFQGSSSTNAASRVPPSCKAAGCDYSVQALLCVVHETETIGIQWMNGLLSIMHHGKVVPWG